MFAPERLEAIKKIVRKHRRLDFAELQQQVKVSSATLRRDLTELERSGEIIRVHGGVLDPTYVRSEVSFDERVMRKASAKKAIAAAVASMIPSGSTVFVDAGSTCLEAGKALLPREDVRLISHSATLLQAALHGKAPLLCIGGELRKVSGALTGGAALGALSALRYDIALIGTSGLDARQGCSTTELSEAQMKKAILAGAKRKILLADQSKWQNPSTVSFAAWADLDEWITDEIPAPRDVKPLRSGGLKIHQA
jgi:DeoR family transcriptional regulator, fructose operon transcriptional repressor